MSKSNTLETDLLQLLFNGTAIANVADNAGTSPLGDLYVALHTADPADPGVQTTSEAAYTSYARVAVPRSAGGWTVSGNSVSPASSIEFPTSTGGSETITHFTIGTDSTGAGRVLYHGTVTPSLLISTGATPQLLTTTAITED